MLPRFTWLQFPFLAGFSSLCHGFSLRDETIPFQNVNSTLLSQSLPLLGLHTTSCIVQGEQTHGNQVAIVTPSSPSLIPHVDALITREKQIVLAIRTADCAPLFIYDPKLHACGLAHSGRRGTELNILQKTVDAMRAEFGSYPSSLHVAIGPCIRPPFYETDFAATIRKQAREAGIHHLYDCGLNTAEDLSLFYSYRMERGNTARHYSVIALI
ncbi:MAG: polyphenol oxidase family protein [Methylacidiphilales bacterium]|nr:polyphenol oxidase family protein [Candidatus Methylacidiphilales bacterium]MDW8350045.1 polyphenol oxidase family protein [Verrucomicrobiae bacterium]